MGIKFLRRDSRGRQLWQIDYYPQGRNGPRKYQTIVGTKLDARQFLDDRLAARMNAAAGIPAPAAGLAEAIAEYVAGLELSHREGHVRNVRRTLAGLAAELLGRQVDAVTHDWLLGWRSRRAQTGLAARTANRELAEVRAFLEAEVIARRLRDNPAAHIPHLREDHKPPRWFRPAEYAEVWRRAKPPIRDAMDVLVTTGLRLGELQRARPEHLAGGRLLVQNRKARDAMALAVGPELGKLLAGRLEALPWTHLSRLCQHIRKLSKKVRGGPYNAHSLRHTCACWAISGKAGIYAVKAHLGHSSVTTTELYLHSLAGFDWRAERKNLPARTRRLFEEWLETAT